MDPLTLALIAGGASLAGGLPDIIPSKYERDQKKKLKELQRQQELGTLGLTTDEQSRIAEQFAGQGEQAAAAQKAMMSQYGQLQGQPGQAAVAMVAAGEQAQRIGAEKARAITAADLQKKAEQEQEIRDLEAAQAEYRKARQEALVRPLVEGATAGVSSVLQQQAINQLLGIESAQPAKPVSPYREIAKTITQNEYGFTDTEFDNWWATVPADQQAYYGRIR